MTITIRQAKAEKDHHEMLFKYVIICYRQYYIQ